MAEKELPFCECGECGLRVTKKGNRFITGHHMRGIPRTPETCAKMSDTHTGVPLSPEHIAAISAGTLGVPKSPRTPEMNAATSEGMKNSDAAKAAAEKQRGGLDLVWHHVAYDFGRPDALRVRITRKFHGQIHHPKGFSFSERGYSLID